MGAPKQLAPPLLAWFYENRRLLPFRQEPSPYHIWVSEIMLQQTRMTAAVPYYERFIQALPDIPALAECGAEELHKLWQGLGYYHRAANLQKAAQLVCQNYDGQLPADYDALRALPGIGDYTAGAVASIGFGIPAPAVDGNVLRVFARLYNSHADITRPETKREFTALVMEHQPPDAPGDYNQALMELGALVCLPNAAPLCDQCPLAAQCAGHGAGDAAYLQSLPVKPEKKPRPTIPVTVLRVESPAGILLKKRPARGLLAGLWQPLAVEGEALSKAEAAAHLKELGLEMESREESIEPMTPARHIFTHKVWALSGWRCLVSAQPAPAGTVWASPNELDEKYAVPSAFLHFVV